MLRAVIRALGRVAVVEGATTRYVDGARRQLLLCLLASQANHPVSADWLCTHLWPENAPATQATALRVHISALRRFSDTIEIETVPGGYRLLATADSLDLLALRQRGERARDAAAADDLDGAAGEVRAALDIRSGRPFDGFEDHAILQPAAASLDRALREMVDALANTALRCRRPEAAIPTLRATVETADLADEQLVSRLAECLWAGGHSTEAAKVLREQRSEAGGLSTSAMQLLSSIETGAVPQLAVATFAAGSAPARASEGTMPMVDVRHLADGRAPLVARDRELRRLASIVQRARQDGPLFAMLQGPAGIGKTRLCLEFLDRQGTRADTLVVRCEPDLRRPVTALLTALGDVELPSELGGPQEAAEQARAALTESVRASLAARTAERPLCLLLDDLHEADSVLLSLVRELVQMGGLPGVVLLATVRIDGEAPAPIRHLRDRSARTDRFDDLTLAPFDPSDIAALLTEWGVVPAGPDESAAMAIANEVHDLSGGNPYFTVCVAEQMRRHGGESPTSSAHGSLGRVGDVFADRVETLTDDARAAVELCAVIGREVDLRVLEVATEASTATLLGHLEAPLGLGLLHEAAGLEDHVAFEHSLLRTYLFERVPVTRRRQLHARAAAAMAALPEWAERRPVTIADQWLSAGTAHQSKAFPLLVRGARLALADLAVDEAVALVERARPLADGDEARAQLHIIGAEIAVADGRFDDARASYRTALTHAYVCSADVLITAAAVGSTGAYLPNQIERGGVQLITDALEVVRRDESRAELLARRVLLLHGGPPHTAEAKEAAMLANQSGDDRVRAIAAHSLALCTHGPHSAAPRRAVSLHGAAAAARAGLADAEFVLRVDQFVAEVELGAMADAADVLQRSHELIEARPMPLNRWRLASMEVVLATVRGELEVAEELALDARDVARRLQIGDGAAWYFMQLFTIRWRQGRLDELTKVFEPTVESALHLSWRAAGAAVIAAADAARAQAVVAGWQEELATLPQDYLWTGTLALAKLAADACESEHAPAIAALLRPHIGEHAVYGSVCAYVGEITQEVSVR